MRFIIYDIEVFAYDWVVVFKDILTGTRYIYHNENESVYDFMKENAEMFVGFNNKHYDNHIVKAIASDFSPEEVKKLNDYIIVYDGNGWEYPPLRDSRFWFSSYDLMDDCQQGLSLKAIEAHLGMDIEETEVDFDIDRPLTPDELEKTIKYCCHDVDATEKLFYIREDYMKNKLQLGRMSSISDERALYMTNAKLTATYLSAVAQQHNDERDYQYPSNLLKEYIPDEVFDFFNKMHDSSIPDEELFKGKYVSNIGSCTYTLGFGGIHGDCGNAVVEETEEFIIVNEDVASYYPHLMTVNNYCSRSIPDPKIYEDMLERRMAAKKSGDKATANALKLVANTTYGAMLAKWNDLYDPLMGRSVCISGQLYLLELGYHLHSLGDDNVKIVQMNTDGITFTVRKTVLDQVNAITAEWQKRTGFELERDVIKKVVQKDVNNYIEIKHDGSVKSKGGYLVKGIAPAGAFNINNNFTIVSKAVVNYFVDGTPIKETIENCNEPLSFQIIAKAGSKYTGAYHIVGGERIPTQRVNRVYATKNREYGTIVKVHALKGNDNKIGGLPDHCIIDNRNVVDIADIDKNWYIRQADKYIKDFLGVSRKGKRGNTRKINSIKKQILKILEVN